MTETLTAAALIQAEAPPQPPEDQEPVLLFRMHPGVAQDIRAAVGPDVQNATDTELAAFWWQVSAQARQQEEPGGEAGPTITRAGLSAAPYLLRLQDWNTASALLQQALSRDESPATIQAALPALRAIADATQAPQDLGILAKAMARADPAGAEEIMRGALDQAIAAGDYRFASSAGEDLANLLMDTGRLHEALSVTEQLAGYTRQAGLGPWTQLAEQGRRLQILELMGQHEQVLDAIPALREQMDTLSATADSNDPVVPWNVREATLEVGHTSALALGEWQQALDLNIAILASEHARGVSTYEITRTRFSDYRPLIELGRLIEAEQLLISCQQVFEDHQDLTRLARVFGARAVLEDERGNPAAALAFQQAGIRYSYAQFVARDIAAGHYNLARYLGETGSDPAARRAHRLAAALIYSLTGMTHNFANTCRALARELRRDSGGQHLPGTLEEVIRTAGQTEGVHLGQLITALRPPGNLEYLVAKLAGPDLEECLNRCGPDDNCLLQCLAEG